MEPNPSSNTLRYSVSLVTQGRHRFYTLTMPSDVLAQTCFVSNRFDDPKEGFQRLLDRKRAEEIAQYIDTGLGTIPNSVVLSAQPDANLKVVGKGKTLEFQRSNKAFLILDGQHRIYGFSIAKNRLRVPVVIYNSLSRTEETRLFIDINTKQRPVPNELLLDIKSLADYESDQDTLLRQVFDCFNTDTASPLVGKLSPAQRALGKVTRVTFNGAMNPLLSIFAGSPPEKIYTSLAAYFSAMQSGLTDHHIAEYLTNPTVFRAVASLFREVAQRVKDRYGPDYTADHFSDILSPLFAKLTPQQVKKPGRSYRSLCDYLSKCLKQDFTLT